MTFRSATSTPRKKPTFDKVVDMKLAKEAVEAAGGRVTIGKCTRVNQIVMLREGGRIQYS